MESKTISSIPELKEFAAELIMSLKTSSSEATVLALSGDLGAGKTTFVQQLAQVLGIEEPITSPTFTLMKRYETTHEKFTTLLHMDAYRLESEEELAPLRFDELLAETGTLFCIEWAERIETALPKGVVKITLAIGTEDKRIIQIEK